MASSATSATEMRREPLTIGSQRANTPEVPVRRLR
jgi:hypothetical protein